MKPNWKWHLDVILILFKQTCIVLRLHRSNYVRIALNTQTDQLSKYTCVFENDAHIPWNYRITGFGIWFQNIDPFGRVNIEFHTHITVPRGTAFMHEKDTHIPWKCGRTWNQNLYVVPPGTLPLDTLWNLIIDTCAVIQKLFVSLTINFSYFADILMHETFTKPHEEFTKPREALPHRTRYLLHHDVMKVVTSCQCQ